MGAKLQNSETVFPAGVIRAHSSHLTETTGAYEEMDLHAERIPRVSTSQYRRNCLSPVAQNNYGYYNRDRPLLVSASVPANELQQIVEQPYSNSYTSKASDYPQKERIFYYKDKVSSERPGVSQPKNQSPSSLGDIYRNSSNAVEFASNFEQYLTSCMPSYFWMTLMCTLALWGLVLIIIGTFNVPFCPSQPMIPIFLIVAGCLYLLWAVLRIYSFWPSSRAENTLDVDLTCKVSEGIAIVAMLVWLLMGSIWVYGPEQYIQFERNYFERHYCSGGVYWIAFITVTIHLAIIALGLLLLACMLCAGLLKDNR